jgi:hypothetical protein
MRYWLATEFGAIANVSVPYAVDIVTAEVQYSPEIPLIVGVGTYTRDMELDQSELPPAFTALTRNSYDCPAVGNVYESVVDVRTLEVLQVPPSGRICVS